MNQRVPATMPWIVSGLYGLGLPFALLAAGFSVMLFDAPGSEKNRLLWIVAGGLGSIPVLMLLAIIGVWIAWRVTRDWPPERQGSGARLRWMLAGLPVLGVLAVVVGSVLVGIFCGGSFSCGAQ